jgi:hypothetical protein
VPGEGCVHTIPGSIVLGGIGALEALSNDRVTLLLT